MALSDEIIRQRLQLLESYMQHLQGYRVRTRDAVCGDMSLTWAVEHGLQLSIQCVIDVCHYLVADLALGILKPLNSCVTQKSFQPRLLTRWCRWPSFATFLSMSTHK
jgi:uncharacterized protein YutE (UPF0331/DUF86 family)